MSIQSTERRSRTKAPYPSAVGRGSQRIDDVKIHDRVIAGIIVYGSSTGARAATISEIGRSGRGKDGEGSEEEEGGDGESGDGARHCD